MKLSEIIERLDRADANKAHIDTESFSQDTGVNCYFDTSLETHGFSAYYIQKWLCTDSWVGMTAIFYQDEFVCISYQSARKSDIQYYWVNKEAQKKVARALAELMLEQQNHQTKFIDEFNDEMGAGYKLNYSTELLTDHAIYDPTGETVKITKKWDSWKDIDLWHHVEVRFPNGEFKVVKIDRLTIPYPISDTKKR